MDRRIAVAKQLYVLAGVDYDDKEARQREMLRNFSFFDAPAAIFLTVDAIGDRNAWAHAGLFAMSLVLALQAHGLSTCFQEAWAPLHGRVRAFLALPDAEVVWCGVAVGYALAEHPVNSIRTDRRSVNETATFHVHAKL